MNKAHISSRGWMEGPTHHYPLRVFFEDTDAAGVVFYANYLKFMERARTTMTLCLGADHSDMFLNGGPFFVVRRVEVDYLRPAKLGDELVVHTRFESIKGPRAFVHQEIWRDDVCLIQAKVVLVSVDSHSKPVRVPVIFGQMIHF